MTSRAFTDYFVKHPKQFRYIKLRKMHSEKVHRHKRKSLFLFQSNYIQLQSVVPSITSRKHTIQAIPSKKKNKKGKGKEERENEKKEKERKEVVLKIKPTSPHECACFSPYLAFLSIFSIPLFFFPFLTFLN